MDIMQIGGAHELSCTKCEMPPGEGGKNLSAPINNIHIRKGERV